MARPPSIDLTRLSKLHAAGRTVQEMAVILHCNEKTIRRHLARFGEQAPFAVLAEPERVDRAVSHTLDAQDEWFKLHQEARHALAELKKAGEWPDAVRAIRVLQQSLDQFLKMAEMLHDFRAVQEFQKEVLDVIGGVAPDVRQEIIRRLDEKRSLRVAVSRS